MILSILSFSQSLKNVDSVVEFWNNLYTIYLIVFYFELIRQYFIGDDNCIPRTKKVLKMYPLIYLPKFAKNNLKEMTLPFKWPGTTFSL